MSILCVLASVHAVWEVDGRHVNDWVQDAMKLSETRSDVRQPSNVKKDQDSHNVMKPANVPAKWKMLLYDLLGRLPLSVDRARFLVTRTQRLHVIVLHLNCGHSGTTFILRWLPEVLGRYFAKVSFEIFVCDSNARYARAPVAGVSLVCCSLANAWLTEACVACLCQQVRDDLRRDGDIEVNVHELRDHRAALDSRDIFAVLENFFRLLLVRSNVACLVCWTNPVGMMTRAG